MPFRALNLVLCLVYVTYPGLKSEHPRLIRGTIPIWHWIPSIITRWYLLFRDLCFLDRSLFRQTIFFSLRQHLHTFFLPPTNDSRRDIWIGPQSGYDTWAWTHWCKRSGDYPRTRRIDHGRKNSPIHPSAYYYQSSSNRLFTMLPRHLFEHPFGLNHIQRRYVCYLSFSLLFSFFWGWLDGFNRLIAIGILRVVYYITNQSAAFILVHACAPTRNEELKSSYVEICTYLLLFSLFSTIAGCAILSRKLFFHPTSAFWKNVFTSILGDGDARQSREEILIVSISFFVELYHFPHE